MRFTKIISGVGFAVLTVLNPSTANATVTTSGTVYFDLAALTAELQTNTIGFNGWQYASSGTATAGGVSDIRSLAAPDLLANVGDATASTHAGSISVAAGLAGAGQCYQEMTASIQLAAGQHFVYSVGYTMIMHKELLPERVDLGAGFVIDSDDGGYTIDKSVTTLDWKVPLGTGSESNVFEIDLYNPYDIPMTYSFKGWLGAANASPGSVVPEPSMYLMLLVGLGMIGFVGRRRKMAPAM